MAGTWPESQWPSFHARRLELAARLDAEQSSDLVFFFEDWEYVRAVRVRSAVLLTSLESFWKP
jgi:hypothetical protein